MLHNVCVLLDHLKVNQCRQLIHIQYLVLVFTCLTVPRLVGHCGPLPKNFTSGSKVSS